MFMCAFAITLGSTFPPTTTNLCHFLIIPQPQTKEQKLYKLALRRISLSLSLSPPRRPPPPPRLLLLDRCEGACASLYPSLPCSLRILRFVFTLFSPCLFALTSTFQHHNKTQDVKGRSFIQNKSLFIGLKIIFSDWSYFHTLDEDRRNCACLSHFRVNSHVTQYPTLTL
jgi:hypothetical protein